uniref:Gnk2-homologous domain-containing protein n=1 Tax=Triticum urartu TaxID=4572 RepID=A0A8R7U2A6_TRIUA
MRFLSSVDLPCYPWMAMVILPLLLLLMPLTAAQLWPSCGESGDYKSNSTYEANLKLLSTTLPKKAASSTNLFATDTVGNVPNVIFALALCRGDSNASACEGCLVTAFQDAQEHCANYKDATVYYDSNPCMLRFSNQNFLATTVNDHILVIVSIESLMMNIPTRADSFKLLLFTLLNSTAQSAANSSRRFTTSRLDVNSFPTLYCLMQCTPDLTANDCTACLQPYFQYTVKYMDGKKGGRVLGTRCTMRYEIFPFFQGDPMLRIINLVSEVPAINNTTPLITVNPSPQSQSPSPVAAPPPPGAQATTKEIHGRNSRQRPLWIIAVAAPLLSIFLCVICFVVWMRRRRKGRKKTRWFGDWKGRVQSSLCLTYLRYCVLHTTSPKKTYLGKVVLALSTRASYQMEQKLQLKGLPHIQDRVSQNSKMKLNLLQNYNTVIWSSSWDAALRERKNFWCTNICQIRAWTSSSLMLAEQLWLIGKNGVS